MHTIETHTVRKGGENYRVIIEVDDDAPNPLTDESGLGILLSLNHRHRNYDPEAVERAVACNQDFVPLSYFEHGLCRWAVAGELPPGADCPWDSVTFAGLWLPDEDTLQDARELEGDARRQFMRESARSACEIYTSWCNGEVYRFRVDRISVCPCCGSEQVEEADACSGIYGLDECRTEAMAMFPAGFSEASGD